MRSKIGFLPVFLVVLLMLMLSSTFLWGRSVNGGSGADKRLDIFHYHNVGNIWLRISNYGFFGSGDDVVPQWPSLEYPGGSGIDYLYQGALWFGACKQRRNDFGQMLYWQDAAQETTGTTNMEFGRVIDTLVTVGFDGDADYYEFLPAYNPLEENVLGPTYDIYNLSDGVVESSIRDQEPGEDDDGDGRIDEDPAGFAFPYRSTMPNQFSTFLPGDNEFRGAVERTQCEPAEILSNIDIWFPLGFLDLGYVDPDSIYNFAQAQDDDGDLLRDEDGYPISEQDYLGYYYDYSPFGTPGERVKESSSYSQEHIPNNIRVRQVSFQWSYEYIKNLVYVEFDITNMNPIDTLFDCAMAVYMDCDVGPQAWGATSRAGEDISSYVPGEGYEFAYTYDADQDGGLTTGYIGARVCSPDPEQLEFACWTWEVGDGPTHNVPNAVRNEKYWLMTHNTDSFDLKFTSLREDPGAQLNDPVDTRFLFAFYGDKQGFVAPTDSSWNLKPYETMKIVIAVFPGEDIEELKRTAVWSKTLYGEAQTLTTVVLPDTFRHYEAPGPPDIPNMTLDQSQNGDTIFVYWDNRSEFTVDRMTLTKEFVGWQNTIPYLDSYISKYDEQLAHYGYFPEEFNPDHWNGGGYNINAKVNPWTAFRLRHDYQGYSLWKASNSGEQDAYMRINRWDKVDTPQDMRDYDVCMDLPVDSMEVYYGGQLGINNGILMKYIVGSDPVKDIIYTTDSTVYWTDYYRLDSLYSFTNILSGDEVHGIPLYNILDSADVNPPYAPTPAHPILTESEKQANALLLKNLSIDDKLYLALYDDKLIPFPGHLGQAHPEGLLEFKKNRLSRRYYISEILYPEKGVENYFAVTTFDRGIPSQSLQALESGKDGNRITVFAGPSAASNLDDVYVVPNPYLGQSKFDGRRDKDENGDRSKRIWFVNLPEKCSIKIYTLAGDLVDEIEHNGTSTVDVINPSKATHTGIAPGGMEPWDLLSKHDQIIASGVYLYSVKDHATGNVKVDKLVLIK